MAQGAVQRGMMAAFGGLAGACLYGLSQAIDHDLLSERMGVVLLAFALVLFGAGLAMAGPVRMGRALMAAAVLALVVAGLSHWAGLRYETLSDVQPFPVFAALVLASLPVPFVMAALAGPGWWHYPSLFTQAWGLFVRLSLAGIFVGVVWGVVLLSNALFGLIGLTVLQDLLDIEVVPWLITGASLGLALAVVNELTEVISPFLILRLMRLLVAPVLLVLLVFVIALPVRGISGLFGGLSSAGTLLAMVAAAVTLVSAAVDQSEVEAVSRGWNARATRALALVVVVPAGLAAWALWLRVEQYGWTPERLFATWMAVLALGYGGLYAWAALRPGWQAAVRRANVVLALALIGSAALWLTPLLNPEAISAHSQLARFEAAGRKAEGLDIYALGQWGRPGTAALADLKKIAAEPGQEALAKLLAGEGSALTAQDQAARLLPILPLQPATATATRDAILAATDASTLNYWRSSCEVVLPDGQPGCVMVVGDFLTDLPGAEALVVTSDADGNLNFNGFSVDKDGVHQHTVQDRSGYLSYEQRFPKLLKSLQENAPITAPAPMNMLTSGDRGLMLLP